MSVQAGQTVSAPINVTGANGFSGQVTFACSGLPVNTSCSFSPATITVSGTPAVPTLLSVSTAASSTVSQLGTNEGRGPGTAAYSLVFAGLLLFWPIRRREVRLRVLLICTFAFTALALNGCSGGGGSSSPKAAPGTFDFMVTASSGNVQTQTAYTLVVQ